MLYIISKTPIGSFTDEYAVNMRNWLFEMILDNHTNCGPKPNAKLSEATEVDESSPKEDVVETNNGGMQVTSPRRIKVKVPKELKVTDKMKEIESVDEEVDYGLEFTDEYTDESEVEESDSKEAKNKVKPNVNKTKEDTSKGKRKQRRPLPTQGKRKKSNNDDHPEVKEEIKKNSSSGTHKSTTKIKETSNTESKKSSDEKQEDQKAIHQHIKETWEKMKIEQLRQDQGLEIDDDFSGDSIIWITRQVSYYINQAKKERGINTTKRDLLESQMSIDNNDAKNTQSSVQRQEVLICFKPEY